MTSFDERKKTAIRILEEKQVWQPHRTPLLMKFLWARGVRIPPFPVAPFWLIALLAAPGFGLPWGMFMWFFAWQKADYTITAALIAGSVAGLLFGLMAAGSHLYRRKVKKLPEWKSL